MSCPYDWSEFQGGCYKLYGGQSGSWPLADATCLVDGARLASVHSEEEDSFLNNLANGRNYWIGGYPKARTWVWSDFTSFDFDDYSQSAAGGCLYQSNTNYGQGWTSATCSYNYNFYFICKQMIFNN